MKRCVLFVLLTLCIATARAQTGLNINALFDGRFKQSPVATEILVQGDNAAEMGLDIYRSLTVTDMAQAQAIETAVMHDGAKAETKEVEYRGGRLYYAFYDLGVVKSVKGKKPHYRYLFYLNRSLARSKPQNRVTLIYVESRRDAKSIKSLIKK